MNYPKILPTGPEEIHKNLSQNTSVRCLGRDLNAGPQIYEAGV
jgi:hypothetical protein